MENQVFRIGNDTKSTGQGSWGILILRCWIVESRPVVFRVDSRGFSFAFCLLVFSRSFYFPLSNFESA